MMRFAAIDSKFNYNEITEIEVDSMEQLIEKVKAIKPTARKVETESYKAGKYCAIDGTVLLTNDEIYIMKINKEKD